MKASFSWILVAAMLTGCTATQLTNLTPSKLPRTEVSMYPFEVTWKCKRRGVSEEVEAAVLLDGKVYPMKPVPGTKDRWEALIGVPTDKPVVPYRYKFTYRYPGTITTHPNSDLSPQYFLYIK